MKSLQFYIVLALGALCLILSITVVVVGQMNQHTQLDFQKRQNEIQIEVQKRQAEVQKGAMSDRIGGAILQDMAAASLKNSKIKDVLAKNGYNVQLAPSPSPSATSSIPFKP